VKESRTTTEEKKTKRKGHQIKCRRNVLDLRGATHYKGAQPTKKKKLKERDN